MRGLWRDARDLRPVLAMLGLPRMLLVRAVALGSLTLAASVALAGTSAWLIVRAAQLPPVMFLNVAAVGVRTFGVTRGVSRYLDRLASHDLALRGVVELRTTLYERLSQGRTEQLATLRRGDLLARTGADADDVGDVVVRGVVPALVAVVTCLGAVGALAVLWWPSALVLAACLVVSAVVVPWLAAGADTRAEHARLAARTRVTDATETFVTRAAELALTGGRDRALADLAGAHTETRAAERLAARPLAASAGLAVLATGASIVGSLLVAIPAATSGRLSATALGVVALLPLAVFEATAPLPAAASQLRRSAQAARRITALLDATAEPDPSTPRAGPHLPSSRTPPPLEPDPSTPRAGPHLPPSRTPPPPARPPRPHPPVLRRRASAPGAGPHPACALAAWWSAGPADRRSPGRWTSKSRPAPASRSSVRPGPARPHCC